MKIAANAGVVLGSMTCFAMLAISTYPGLLNNLAQQALIVSAMCFPLTAVVAVVGLIFLVWIAKGNRWKNFRPQATAMLAVLIGTLLLLTFYVPRRIAFAIAKPEFVPLLATAPTRSTYGSLDLNKSLGPYFVDLCGADPRGGVYFRTYDCSLGFGPDTISYGFCFQPNPHGTPLGDSFYRIYPLNGDWYWFRAANGE